MSNGKEVFVSSGYPKSIKILCIHLWRSKQDHINSLAPGEFEWNFRYVIFKRILVIDGWDVSCEITVIWMSLNFTDDQSTVVQVMAWCRQATRHYLSQCWPRSLSPYGVKPHWVKYWEMTKALQLPSGKLDWSGDMRHVWRHNFASFCFLLMSAPIHLSLFM